MKPLEKNLVQAFGIAAATTFNANNPGHFPGRPLYEGTVQKAVRTTEAEVRRRVAAWLRERAAEARGWAWYHPHTNLEAMAAELEQETS